MPGPDEPFTGEPEETREAIMYATYHALCEHGYADLTIQRIGDEFSKSKSLLYHHYDGKDDLLLDFLEYLLDRFEEDVPLAGHETAADRIRELVDHLAPAEMDDARRSIIGAIVELRAQAVHDEAFREQFTRTDRLFRERIAEVVREGVDAGEFRDVDREQVAEFLFSAFHGAMLRRVTAEGEGDVAAVRAEVEAYVDERLVARD